jgi:hypothetical protein
MSDRESDRGRPARRMPPAIRRLCLVVDIESYSALDHRDQHGAQSRLAQVLTAAVRRAGVRRGLLGDGVARQDRGDGQLVLLPAGIDEATAISGLVHGLAEALVGVNRARPRLRLRVALAQGVVQAAATGYVGKSIVDACRLVDSAALRDALARAPDRDLAVAFTDDLFRDVVIHGFGGLVGSDFRRVDVVEASKGFATAAWVSEPGMAHTWSPARPTGRWAALRDRRGPLAVGGVVVLVALVTGWAIAADRDDGDRNAGTVVTGTMSTSGPTAPRPRPDERIMFFDDGTPLDRCVQLSGSGVVPEGHQLRLYAQAGDFYYLTLLPADVDRENGSWKFPQVIFGPTARAGVPITLYAALVPNRESNRLTENFDRQYAFHHLPRRVVATHTFTRSADNGPC